MVIIHTGTNDRGSKISNLCDVINEWLLRFLFCLQVLDMLAMPHNLLQPWLNLPNSKKKLRMFFFYNFMDLITKSKLETKTYQIKCAKELLQQVIKIALWWKIIVKAGDIDKQTKAKAKACHRRMKNKLIHNISHLNRILLNFFEEHTGLFSI